MLFFAFLLGYNLHIKVYKYEVYSSLNSYICVPNHPDQDKEPRFFMYAKAQWYNPIKFI